MAAVKLEDDYVEYLARWIAARLPTHPIEREVLRLWLVEDLSPTAIAERLRVEKRVVELIKKAYRARASVVDLRRAARLLERRGLL